MMFTRCGGYEPILDTNHCICFSLAFVGKAIGRAALDTNISRGVVVLGESGV